MKHKRFFLLIMAIQIVLLTGCWDEKLLRDTRFILAIGLDKGKHGEITGIYSTPNANNYPNSTILTTVQAHTVRRLTMDVADKVSENLDTTRIEFIFFGDKLAKEEGIFPYLNISLRDPNNPLNPLLAITKGEVKEYFLTPIPNEKIISEYYNDLIKGAQKRMIFTDVNVLTGSRIFHNEGKDLLIPYLSQSPDKTPRVAGLALFNGSHFTGKTFNEQESILFNIMDNKSVKNKPSLIKKIASNEEPDIENYISINVMKAKRDLNMQVKNGRVIGRIKVNLDVEVIESPLYEKGQSNEYIQKQLRKKFTETGNKILEKLQNANCDGLALGRQLMAFHNDEFKRMNWKEVGYQQADLKVDFDVKIISHGVIR
ncbi:Ger(x)C family spore germination protein [Bacillus sp. AGMB 02131]|uniref:Ger(X)C family spore germination protein n=1 Tax=Peribacillus faecalis TaxID=2772559 RepID=A0A927HCA1_9BACI|nr:Ger(x)C family spore germination protein [Peribacillus faecalis]MBD3109356.1 Ger(x)C family spore germination protein [Peribacillus faecalis]